MITVTIETEGDSRTMRATGHAGYNFDVGVSAG